MDDDTPAATFEESKTPAVENASGREGQPPTSSVNAGETLKRNGAFVDAPSTIPLPEGLSADVERAATHLWKKYAGDPKIAGYLEFEMEQQLFDPMVDAVNDDYRMGLLMSNIPVDERPVTPPIGPLSVTMLDVETATEHKVDRPLDHLRQALQSNPGADILMAPEWLFVPKGRFHSESEMQEIVRELVAMSKGNKTLMVPGTIAWVDNSGAYHNTALAIEDGKILKRYDKRNDGDDEDFAKNHGATYARGETDSLFQWKGRTVALEICRDHGDARARWDLEEKGQPTVDLQLVVSNGVDLKHPAVGMGGVALVSNGASDAGKGAHFWGGRRTEREEGDHPLFVRTTHQEVTEVALKSGSVARTMVV